MQPVDFTKLFILRIRFKSSTKYNHLMIRTPRNLALSRAFFLAYLLHLNFLSQNLSARRVYYRRMEALELGQKGMGLAEGVKDTGEIVEVGKSSPLASPLRTGLSAGETSSGVLKPPSRLERLLAKKFEPGNTEDPVGMISAIRKQGSMKDSGEIVEVGAPGSLASPLKVGSQPPSSRLKPPARLERLPAKKYVSGDPEKPAEMLPEKNELATFLFREGSQDPQVFKKSTYRAPKPEKGVKKYYKDLKQLVGSKLGKAGRPTAALQEIPVDSHLSPGYQDPIDAERFAEGTRHVGDHSPGHQGPSDAERSAEGTRHVDPGHQDPIDAERFAEDTGNGVRLSPGHQEPTDAERLTGGTRQVVHPFQGYEEMISDRKEVEKSIDVVGEILLHRPPANRYYVDIDVITEEFKKEWLSKLSAGQAKDQGLLAEIDNVAKNLKPLLEGGQERVRLRELFASSKSKWSKWQDHLSRSLEASINTFVTNAMEKSLQMQIMAEFKTFKPGEVEQVYQGKIKDILSALSEKQKIVIADNLSSEKLFIQTSRSSEPPAQFLEKYLAQKLASVTEEDAMQLSKWIAWPAKENEKMKYSEAIIQRQKNPVEAVEAQSATIERFKPESSDQLGKPTYADIMKQTELHVLKEKLFDAKLASIFNGIFEKEAMKVHTKQVFVNKLSPKMKAFSTEPGFLKEGYRRVTRIIDGDLEKALFKDIFGLELTSEGIMTRMRELASIDAARLEPRFESVAGKISLPPGVAGELRTAASKSSSEYLEALKIVKEDGLKEEHYIQLRGAVDNLPEVERVNMKQSRLRMLTKLANERLISPPQYEELLDASTTSNADFLEVLDKFSSGRQRLSDRFYDKLTSRVHSPKATSESEAEALSIKASENLADYMWDVLKEDAFSHLKHSRNKEAVELFSKTALKDTIQGQVSRTTMAEYFAEPHFEENVSKDFVKLRKFRTARQDPPKANRVLEGQFLDEVFKNSRKQKITLPDRENELLQSLKQKGVIDPDPLFQRIDERHIQFSKLPLKFGDLRLKNTHFEFLDKNTIMELNGHSDWLLNDLGKKLLNNINVQAKTERKMEAQMTYLHKYNKQVYKSLNSWSQKYLDKNPPLTNKLKLKPTQA